MIVIIDDQENTRPLFPIVCVGGIIYFEKTLTPRFDHLGKLSKCDIGSVTINDLVIE